MAPSCGSGIYYRRPFNETGLVGGHCHRAQFIPTLTPESAWLVVIATGNKKPTSKTCLVGGYCHRGHSSPTLKPALLVDVATGNPQTPAAPLWDALPAILALAP